MEQVRKNEQNKLSRGLRRYFKRSKHLLRKPMEALSSEEQERLALMVEIAPRLADAYRLKNEFLAVMHSESSTVGKQRLLDWLAAVNVMDLPEFQACVTAYRNWFQEILNSMDVPWSNASSRSATTKQRSSSASASGCGTSGTSEIGSFSAAVYRKNRAGAKHPDTVLD